MKIISRECIDVVHLNNGLSENLLALLAGRLKNKPIVAHVRGTEPLLKLEKLICHWVDYYFMQNFQLIALWMTSIPKEKIVKVVNTIDRDILVSGDTTQVKRSLGLPTEAPIVGYAGRLVEGKGVDVLIKAAQSIVSREPAVRFLIVGAGPIRSELERAVYDFGLRNNVQFTGWRADVGELISCFDILVQSTTTFPESFGNTVIEAMALGKPVVATRVPGPEEIVINGKTGFLVQPGRVDELADRIDQLLKDPILAHKMGLEGQRVVTDVYNPSKQARVYEEIYAKLANADTDPNNS